VTWFPVGQRNTDIALGGHYLQQVLMRTRHNLPKHMVDSGRLTTQMCLTFFKICSRGYSTLRQEKLVT